MIELGAPSGVVSAEAAVRIDGRSEPRLSAGLLSLIVDETTEGLFRCEARFGNAGSRNAEADYLYFDRRLLDFGKQLAVTLGSGDGSAEVFAGRISALEGQFRPGEPPQIVALAEDAAHPLRVTRRTRVFEDMTDAAAFEQIAADHGLRPEIQAPGPTHKVIAQLNQSDLAFVRERARRLAAEVWVADGALFVQARPRRSRQEGEELMLEYNRGLLEFSVIADTANQHTEVTVSGWDVAAKEGLSYAATESALGSELDGDAGGAGIVNAAFGPRVDRIAHLVPRTSAEAQAVAEAAFQMQARRFVVGRGLARGDGRLRVGRAIAFRGLGPLFSGRYYVTEARHVFDRGPGGGYSTSFAVERPGIGQGQGAG